jgi:hypothetical protein
MLRPWWRRLLAFWTERPMCRVLYEDGQWSRPMSYREADDMAAMFRGEVRWAEEFRGPEF